MIRSDQQILAPIAIDTNLGYHFQIVVPKASAVDSLDDLAGKKLVLGSEESAELSILPRHYLPLGGLDMSKLTVVSLSGRLDAETRKPIDGESFVADAVIAGLGDAGVVGDAYAATLAADPASALKVIWTSPTFSHRTMASLPDIAQPDLAAFTELMKSMTTSDPTAKTVLELENGTKWVASSNDGYMDLLDAMGQQGISLE